MTYAAGLVGAVCAPSGTRRARAVQIVINHIEAALRDRHHERFAKLAHEVLITVWPSGRRGRA